MLTLIIFSICRKKIFYHLPSHWNHFFPQSLETKSSTIYTWLERWDYRLSEKNVFGISPVENFKIFLTPNFSLIKKLKFSDFSQFLQLDGASSVCPAKFFWKPIQLPFKQAYFHLDRKRGSPIASKSLLRKFWKCVSSMGPRKCRSGTAGLSPLTFFRPKLTKNQGAKPIAKNFGQSSPPLH